MCLPSSVFTEFAFLTYTHYLSIRVYILETEPPPASPLSPSSPGQVRGQEKTKETKCPFPVTDRSDTTEIGCSHAGGCALIHRGEIPDGTSRAGICREICPGFGWHFLSEFPRLSTFAGNLARIRRDGLDFRNGWHGRKKAGMICRVSEKSFD